MKHRLLLSFAALMLFAGLGHTAFADTLTITFAKANQSTAPGGNPTYSATLTNTSAGTVFLNGDYFSFASPFTPDDSGFVNNAPFSLSAGQSTSFLILFSVPVPAGSTMGTYSGTYSIVGGADGNASTTLGSAVFSTTVTPEPSTWLLMGTGLVGIFVFSRRTGVQDAIRSTLS